MNQAPLHFILLVILIGTVGMLGTDIYLPAIPEMTQVFQCTQSEIQGTFTIFLLGLAICQLIYGGLCDYFGKKNVVLFGLSLFVISSLLCSLATTLDQFLFYRILQAIGGGAGSVVSRAIITSRYTKSEAVKIYSTTFPIVGLSAAIAPLIGGYLTSYFSWKSTFYFIAGYGLIALLMVLRYLVTDDKSNVSSQANQSIYTRYNAVKKYRDVILNPTFLGYTLIICAGFAAFRSYTVESPFVFDKQGYNVEEMGSFYIALSASYLLGNLLAKKLVNHMSVEWVLCVGFCFFGLGGLGFLLGAHFISVSPYMVILPMSMITFGNGLLFPTGSASALASVPNTFSGTASGLVGALQFLTAAACVHWIGEICQGHAPSLSIFIGVILLIGFISYLFLLSFRTKSAEI